MALIEVEHLNKEFKIIKRKPGFWGSIKTLVNRQYTIKKAVDNISFQVNEGEIVGYIGPNGAGKSTTIKMLVGILVPTSGKVLVDNIVPCKNRMENAQKIGVVFGQRTQLWWDIPASEAFNLIRYMYKIPKEQYNANMKLFEVILGIGEFLNTPVRQLSLGQRMRADLCAALLHGPKILYLDEPTIGLDVVVKEAIRNFIKEINEKKHITVILTTHDMSDIEKLCSRVLVIDHGKIMYKGGLEQLKEQFGSEETIIIDTKRPIDDLAALTGRGVAIVEVKRNKAQLKYNKNTINSTSILEWFMKEYQVQDFVVKETEIEEVIRKLYNQSNQGQKPV